MKGPIGKVRHKLVGPHFKRRGFLGLPVFETTYTIWDYETLREYDEYVVILHGYSCRCSYGGMLGLFEGLYDNTYWKPGAVKPQGRAWLATADLRENIPGRHTLIQKGKLLRQIGRHGAKALIKPE